MIYLKGSTNYEINSCLFLTICLPIYDCCVLLFVLLCLLRDWKKPHCRKDDIFRHKTIVNRLHVVLHFVRSWEFFLAHRTREYFPLVAFVVQECVPLKTIFILKCLLYINFCTFCALIDALIYWRIPEQIQTSYRHFGQLFGRILTMACRSTSCTFFNWLSTGWRTHLCRLCIRYSASWWSIVIVIHIIRASTRIFWGCFTFCIIIRAAAAARNFAVFCRLNFRWKELLLLVCGRVYSW